MKHRLLRAQMVEQGIDGIHMARILHLSRATVSHKLCARTPWKSDEIVVLRKTLHIDQSEIPRYFFDGDSA